MFVQKTIGWCVLGAALSACGASAEIPPLSLQEDAIQTCAKAEGDAIFPITVDILAFSGDRGIATILPTERLSEEGASRINACARATAEAAVLTAQAQPAEQAPLTIPALATAIEVEPNVSLVAAPIVQEAEPVAVAAQTLTPLQDCPAGASVLFGGVGYCTN